MICHAIIFSGVSSAFAFADGGKDCVKCHTRDDEKIKRALVDMSPNATDIKILSVGNGPLNGLWEVGFEIGGRKSLAYVDYSYKYIIAGNIFSVADRINLTKESFAKINKVDVSRIPLKDAIIVGDRNADHKIIVFDDPDCSYCAKLHGAMKQVVQERKDISFYIILYPLPFHKEAYAKSKAIVCEKSLTMLEDAFAKKELPEPSCETDVIDENIKLAAELGIRGTPAMVLSDGTLVSGYIDAASIIKLVDDRK